MRALSVLLIAACSGNADQIPLADEVDAATGYQVLVCLPLNYGPSDLVVRGEIWATGGGLRPGSEIQFELLGYEAFPMHCALLPGIPPEGHHDHVYQYRVSLYEPLNKGDYLTLVYFPSTIQMGRDGRRISMADHRGIDLAETRVRSDDRQHFSFNVVPAPPNDHVTITVMPIPEGGLLNPVR